MSSQEILVINKRGEIIFENGSGKLISAKDIVATITQALQLYSKQILHEELQFIRFQNQRMFFLSEQDLISVQLINKNLLTKQFLPTLKIFTKIISRLTNSLNQQNKPIITDPIIKKQMQVFFNIISDPTNTLIVVPKNHIGFLSLIVLFSGFFFDLSKKIDNLLSNITLLENGESLTEIKNSYKNLLVIGVPRSQINLNNEIISNSTFFIGNDALVKLSDLSKNSLSKEVSNFFGIGSNAERIFNLTNSSDVDEIATQLTQLPKEANDILLEAIKESIENSGKSLTKVLYRNLIKKIKEKETEKLTSRAALGYVGDFKTQAEPKVAMQETFVSQEPVNIGNDVQEVTDQQPTIISSEKVELINKLPANLRMDDGKILLDTAPILIDARPYISGKKEKHPDYALSMQIQPVEGDYVEFYILIGPARILEFQKSISDLESRISGELISDAEGISLTIPKDMFYMAFKGILWSLFIEYAYQVQKNVLPKTDIFQVPNEGSVCVIPDGLTPKRRKQLPKQIIEIFEENILIEEIETENPVTIAKSIDILLQKVLNILKYGKGCAIVPRDNSQEVPEIIEFLLLLSEMCGIGWSRW
ncbi:MAG: hypothetical protein HeimC3_26940 [Candidatus Heimdallarchaeota archaeon LC_3]|nr:MAG: hypothetical protein HeimC3_26940 [Candidatus Heimdallarchaeota archaeon LC_3]